MLQRSEKIKMLARIGKMHKMCKLYTRVAQPAAPVRPSTRLYAAREHVNSK